MNERLSIVILSTLAALVMVIAIGCGGGGAAITPLTPEVRLLRAGNQWRYDVTGQITGGGEVASINGSCTDTIHDLTLLSPSGQQCLSLQRVLEYTANSQQFVAITWIHFAQPSYGRSVYTYGIRENGSDVWYTSPFDGYLDTQSPVAVGNQYSETVTFPDQSVETRSWRVEGEEILSVPAGRFTAYRIRRTIDSAISTDWFVPSLGHSVKRHMTATIQYEGVPVSVTLTLSLGSYDVSTLTITPNHFTAQVADRIQFYAFFQGNRGATVDVTPDSAWHSSDSSVATVDADGELTAVGPGQTEISATYNNITSESTVVTVTEPGPQPTAQYYPLGLHYWWQYTGTPVTPYNLSPQADEPSLTISVPRQVVIEGQVWYELQVKGTDPQEPPGYMYVRHDQDGLAEHVGAGVSIYLLSSPLETGHRWLYGDDTQHYFIVEATGETVDVPAGVYTDCVQVREHSITQADIEYDIFTWYAPGVGPVLTRFPDYDPGSGQTTWVEHRLLDFQPGLP